VPALAGLVRAKWLGWRVDGCEGQGFVTGIGWHHRRRVQRVVRIDPLGSSRRPWCGLPGAAASTTPMATTFTTAPVATAAVG
jgi:hypothetical protein